MISPPQLDPSRVTAARRVRLAAALPALEEAHADARALRLDAWQLAIPGRELTAAGLTGNDLRWLLAHGLMVHAEETTTPGDPRRVFRAVHSLAVGPTTCFLLTPGGAAFCDALLAAAPPAALFPRWDSGQRTLTWNGVLVKWFRTPASNQELVLQAFEEEGWPTRIDDPLPAVGQVAPQVRLHDTIKRLNRGQVHPLLHFGGDGTGCGVRWEAAQAPPDRPHRAPCDAAAG
jgi:hypothetical protein